MRGAVASGRRQTGPKLYPTEAVFRYPGNSRPANRMFADVAAATGDRRKARERDSGAPGGDRSRSAASRRGPSPDTRGPGGAPLQGKTGTVGQV